MSGFSLKYVLAIAFASGLSGHTFAADVDQALLDAGKRVFIKCRTCHSVDPNAGHLLGPNLFGVFGRKAGTAPDFAYSDAVKKSGIVWSDETISQWLANPTTFLPGNKMAFIGLPKEEDRKALLAYLKKKSAEE